MQESSVLKLPFFLVIFTLESAPALFRVDILTCIFANYKQPKLSLSGSLFWSYMFPVFFFLICVHFCLMLGFLPVCSCRPPTVTALVYFTCVSIPSVFKPCLCSLFARVSLLPPVNDQICFSATLDFCLFLVSLVCPILPTGSDFGYQYELKRWRVDFNTVPGSFLSRLGPSIYLTTLTESNRDDGDVVKTTLVLWDHRWACFPLVRQATNH